jgi:hypothetical protein
MSSAFALGCDLNALAAEVRRTREDIDLLVVHRDVNPLAVDRAVCSAWQRIFQAEERIQAIRLEALRMSGDRCVD